MEEQKLLGQEEGPLGKERKETLFFFLDARQRIRVGLGIESGLENNIFLPLQTGPTGRDDVKLALPRRALALLGCQRSLLSYDFFDPYHFFAFEPLSSFSRSQLCNDVVFIESRH